MGTLEAKQALKALRVTKESKSNTAALRAIYDDVEEALKLFSRADVIEALAAQGIRFTPKSFDSALQRIRHPASQATSRSHSNEPDPENQSLTPRQKMQKRAKALLGEKPALIKKD